MLHLKMETHRSNYDINSFNLYKQYNTNRFNNNINSFNAAVIEEKS